MRLLIAALLMVLPLTSLSSEEELLKEVERAKMESKLDKDYNKSRVGVTLRWKIGPNLIPQGSPKIELHYNRSSIIGYQLNRGWILNEKLESVIK